MSYSVNAAGSFILSYLHGALTSHAAQIDKLWDAELRNLQNVVVSSTTEDTYEEFESDAGVRRASEALTSGISKSTNYRRSYNVASPIICPFHPQGCHNACCLFHRRQ